MLLPNLIIPGAQKAATSTLYHCLREHPDCLMSVPKEPMFFARETSAARLEDYVRCFEGQPAAVHGAKVVGEASTAYLPDPQAPERIRKVLGADVKFLVLLRAPAERAVSAYWHMAKRGDDRRDLESVLGVPSSGLQAACDKERDLLARAVKSGEVKPEKYRDTYDEWLWPFRYLENGRYSVYLDHYFRLFPRDNIHIVLFEDLVARPAESLAGIARFLDIGPFAGLEVLPVRNRTLIGWRPAIASLGYTLRYSGIRAAAGAAIPVLATAWRMGGDAPIPRKPRELLAQLRDIYREETGAMSAMLGRDLRAAGW
jgi:hypothetical protein